MTQRQHPGIVTPSVGLLLLTASLLILARLSSGAPSLATPSSDMAFVPAGTFIYGSAKGDPDERPSRSVHLDAYYIDKYEVTNERYLRFFQSIPGLCDGYVCLDTKAENADSRIVYEDGHYVVEAGYEEHPITLVSWYGAQAYCESQRKRLPTEAEWEKAARGHDGRTYPWGEMIDGGRLNAGNRVGGTTPVGSHPAGKSPYGAVDMAGNVWEWTADWYQAYPGSSHDSPFFGEKYRVVRGGSWNHPDRDSRTTMRDLAHPARRIHVVGFRCARSP